MSEISADGCPVWAPLVGFTGVLFALVFASECVQLGCVSPLTSDVRMQCSTSRRVSGHHPKGEGKAVTEPLLRCRLWQTPISCDKLLCRSRQRHPEILLRKSGGWHPKEKMYSSIHVHKNAPFGLTTVFLRVG